MSDQMTIESLREKHMAEVDAKLEELRPAFEEFNDLMAYRESMGGKPRARTATRSTGTRGPRAGVDRKQDVLTFLGEHDGATIPEMAKGLDVSANYLYRVRDGLVDEGLIRKDGQRHFLVKQDEAPKGRGRNAAKATEEPVAA
jgi:hypothetical protein